MNILMNIIKYGRIGYAEAIDERTEFEQVVAAELIVGLQVDTSAPRV